MIRPLAVISIILTPILANCSRDVNSSTIKSTALNDGLATIGRGTRLVMLKELEIPANQSQVEIGPFVSSSYIEGQGNMVLNSYAICGLQVAETSLDRRVLKSGVALELSGEATSHPNGENSEINVEELKISSPAAVTAIGCIKLVRKCFDVYCDPYHQSAFKIQDLENVLKGTARIERANPLPIPSNLH